MAGPGNRKIRPVWSQEEMSLILDQTLSDEQVAQKLPRRTVRAVNQMRRKNRVTAFRYCRLCGKGPLMGRNGLYCPSHKHVYSSWKSVQYGAKRRGFEFELTFQEFHDLAWNKPCVYCGKIPQGYGIDRVDSKKGYIKSNVVPCCLRCNQMKMADDLQEWVGHMERILHHAKSLLLTPKPTPEEEEEPGQA